MGDRGARQRGAYGEGAGERMSPTPEQEARQHIDAALVESGWVVQDRSQLNLQAGRGVAVREFAMARGHGLADYLLFVDGQAVGALEAKPAGYTSTSVELQAEKYASGLPGEFHVPVRPSSLRTRPRHGGHLLARSDQEKQRLKCVGQ